MTRPLALARPQVDVEHRDDGAIVLRSTMQLTERPGSVLAWLQQWAVERPDTPFVTEPTPSGRRSITYSMADQEVLRLAAHLRNRGIGEGDRVVIATPNSIRHLVWGLAVMRAGGVYVPMAPQYVGPGHDEAKLRGLVELLRPALLVVDDDIPVACPVTELQTLDSEAATAVAEPAMPMPAPGQLAKILLTSGSTGLPKAVPYTHDLMVSAMVMTLQVWEFAQVHPPVLLDWLPWNHAFGGTANLHLVLASGGTLHIDRGGPTPEGVATTLREAVALKPTVFFAVPATLDLLRAHLAADRHLAGSFFESVRMIFSAGAALGSDTFHSLKTTAERSGHPIVITSGWGGTETGPGATLLHIADGRPGWVGTPLPGVEVKMTPEAGKLHAAVRGPNVFDGYWGSQTDPFDEEGFYRTGDAVRLVDESRPELGLEFDGRLGDDFKLANGTWVDYAGVRKGLLEALEGRALDVVVGLPDAPHLVALVWQSTADPLPLSFLNAARERYNAEAKRPTDRVVGVAAMQSAPSEGEVSPKGQLRPAQVRDHRRGELTELLRSSLTPEGQR